ncbi:MAG: hypothetical protein ACLURV_13270 [Gallintestinimicrobium sp.]
MFGTVWLTEDEFQKPVSTLGGQKTCVALGKLLQKPDLIILDEPTNHLDMLLDFLARNLSAQL